MAGGRPRTTAFPPEEMIALGQEMVEWIKVNNPLHLSEWYTIEKGFLYEEWKCFIQIKEFLPYYEISLKLVGKQYLDKQSNIRDGISQRWQRVYFKDLKDQEDQDYKDKLDAELAHKKEVIAHEAKAKAQLAEQVQESIMKQYEATLHQLASLRSDFKIEDSNMSNETKS